MQLDLLTDEELNIAHKDKLLMGSYKIYSVNETILDRTHTNNISIDGKQFNCIAHYLQYAKCKVWELSEEICDHVLYKYKADYPITCEKEYIKFEDDFNFEYNDAIRQIPEQYRMKWRELCPKVTASAIAAAYEQLSDFRNILNGTKKDVIVEISPSILWGIDTKGCTMDEISSPINWQGENLYGQLLMAIREKYNGTFFRKLKRVMTTKT